MIICLVVLVGDVRYKMKVIEESGLTEILEGSCAYGIFSDREVHIDKDINNEKKRLAVIHEVLEIRLKGRVRHSKFDSIALDIIDSLDQIGAWK